MDEIETRLKEAAEDCIKAYENWSKQKKNPEAREGLQEATHELRKVAARLEIEIAVSERDDMAQRPIPIPPHRSSNRRPGGNNNGLPDFIKDGNANDEDSTGNVSESFEPRPQQQRQGGPRQGGFQRRPMRRPQGGGQSSGGGEE